jgi:hypothetical protein
VQDLEPKTTPDAWIQKINPGHFHLSIAGGPEGRYRLAQLDDYTQLNRAAFGWEAPCALEIRGRVSARDLPGTWGFGFWNDPFSANLGFSGMARRLPALPNAAWFFYASPPNFLSLRDGGPAQGFLAAIFSSPRFPPLLLAPGLFGLPLLALPPAARLLRRLGRRLVRDQATVLPVDPTGWHTYRIDVQPEGSHFYVDGVEVYATALAQRGRLGRVIWIDNQFAAFSPDGRVKFGSLANPPAWLEVEFPG